MPLGDTKAADGPPLAVVPVDPREPILAASIRSILEKEHLRRRAVDDAASKQAFARYLELIDPDKVFLLASDVEELRAFETKIDDELMEGRFELAHRGAALFARRLTQVESLVAKQLEKPFDLSVDESFEIDGEKRKYCADEAELTERWRKSLKFDVLRRVIRMEDTAEAMAKAKDDAQKQPPDAGVAPVKSADIPPTAEGKEKLAREEIAKSYAGRFARLAAVEPLDPIDPYINAILSIYDPHTNYLKPATKENFDIQMSGSLEGIGAVLQEDDHYIRIVSIVPGGASWRQGDLEAGDLILSVAQQGEQPVDVVDMRIDKVVHMIRGAKGTVVTLQVQKPDEKVSMISITRDVVEIEASFARGAVLTTGAGTKVGYIYLPSFYGNTRARRGNTPERDSSDDVKKLLELLEAKGVTGVVIDVRGNGGGLLDDAQEMTGLFIKSGPVVQTQSTHGELDVLIDDDPSISFNGEVVVLVDKFSASAAEIVAAALQDYDRAIVVGTAQTHGKGTVQALVDLSRYSDFSRPDQPLGVIKLTIQQFFRISGGSTQMRGVVPDIVLADPIAHIESGERHLDHAIAWSEVKSVDFSRWKSLPDRAELLAKSQSRVAKRAVFDLIDKRSKLLASRRDDTVVPLSRDKWIAERDRDKVALEALDPKLTEGKERLGISVIEYDGKKKLEPKGKKGRNTGDPQQRWKESLARDPWVEEAALILGDMAAAR